MPADIIAGLVLGALPLAIKLYNSALGVYDTVISVRNFGDDLADLVLDFEIQKEILKDWGTGCGLTKQEHDPGWGKDKYTLLLKALARMYFYVAKAQMLIDPYVNGGMEASPNLPDISIFTPQMKKAGLEGLSSDIQRTLDDLRMFAATTNNQLSTFKKFSQGLPQVKELEQLIGKIRRLNINLKELLPLPPQGKQFRN
jgi:hypothetical protein